MNYRIIRGLCCVQISVLFFCYGVTATSAQSKPSARLLYQGTGEFPWHHSGVRSWGSDWHKAAVVDAHKQIVEEINKQVNLVAFAQWISQKSGRSIDFSKWVDLNKGSGSRIIATESKDVQSFQSWINANHYLIIVRNVRIKPGTDKTETRNEWGVRSWKAWAIMLFDYEVWGPSQQSDSPSSNQGSQGTSSPVTSPGTSMSSSRPNWAFVEAAGLYWSKPVVVSGANAYERAKRMAATAGARLPTLDEFRMAWPTLSQYSDFDKWFFVFFTDTPGVQWMPLPIGSTGKPHRDQGNYNGLDLVTYVTPVNRVQNNGGNNIGGDSPGGVPWPAAAPVQGTEARVYRRSVRESLVGTWAGSDGRRMMLNADGTGTTWLGNQPLSYRWSYSDEAKTMTFYMQNGAAHTMKITEYNGNSFTIIRPDGSTNTYTRE